jgi:bifunctional UDP-N-acetylglucosamine pyrophosphorylase/glucosamine-1-phosphate N-acetyltransferase
MTLSVVILAAGQGKRMKSDLPKVLQPLAGKPLLGHVLDAAEGLQAAATYVVYGHGGERVPAAFEGRDVHWALQAEQHGTGHAVMQAMPAIPDDAMVLVLYGDVPLVQLDTLARLVAEAGEDSVSLLSVMLPDPTGYGRIVRDGSGRVVRIVEHKDANAKERAIHECNTGLLCAPAGRLRRWLAALGNDNAQGEYYLTDVIVMAVKAGLEVKAVVAPTATEVMGVNDKLQLAELEAAYRRQRAAALMLAGATLVDPARFDARAASGLIGCGGLSDHEIEQRGFVRAVYILVGCETYQHAGFFHYHDICVSCGNITRAGGRRRGPTKDYKYQ